MNTKLDKYRKTLSSLEEFLDLEKQYAISEIYDWIAGCISIFTELKVPDKLVDDLLSDVKLSTVFGRDNSDVSKYGPFIITDQGLAKLKSNHTDYWPSLKICFILAKYNLENLEESERLVPKSLTNYFKDKTKYSQIYSSLQIMEQNFKNKDAEDLAANSIALLSSILNLESTINGKDLSKQLSNIKSDKALIDKFGVRPEVITALDNSRILRNYLTSHKNIPIEYNVPFAVSLGTAYLIIMFLQITMSTGELIK